jgi:hypothetical protein
MKLKLNEDGHVVLHEGKPVYIHDDGKEIPFDAAATVASINSRAEQNRRVEAENKELKDRLKTFDGLDDPDGARKALATLKNLDQKKLIDAGEVESIKAEAKRAYEEQVKSIEEKYKPVVQERDQFKAELITEKVGGSFARSKFINEKLAIPPDMAQAAFGSAFKVENGTVVAYDKAGGKIYSRQRPGEIANFDEAIEQLVDGYPFKDHILRGTGASGGGARGGSGTGGGRTYSRAEFNQIAASDPSKASSIAADVRAGKVELVD